MNRKTPLANPHVPTHLINNTGGIPGIDDSSRNIPNDVTPSETSTAAANSSESETTDAAPPNIQNMQREEADGQPAPIETPQDNNWGYVIIYEKSILIHNPS